MLCLGGCDSDPDKEYQGSPEGSGENGDASTPNAGQGDSGTGDGEGDQTGNEHTNTDDGNTQTGEQDNQNDQQDNQNDQQDNQNDQQDNQNDQQDNQSQDPESIFSLNHSKVVNTLNDEEFDTLITESIDFAREVMGDEDLCKTIAVSSVDNSGDCENLIQRCMRSARNSPSSAFLGLVDIDENDRNSCDSTVGELDDCMQDMETPIQDTSAGVSCDTGPPNDSDFGTTARCQQLNDACRRVLLFHHLGGV